MHTKNIRKLVFAAMLAALVFCATWISFPVGIGNVNLGDAMLLLGSVTLGGPFSVVACALGATLTDLLGGYAVYAPATLVIKALMGVVAILIYKVTSRFSTVVRQLLCGVCAELVMVIGYLLYEAFFLSLGVAALVSVPFNCLQGAFGIAVSMLSYGILKKAKLTDLFD